MKYPGEAESDYNKTLPGWLWFGVGASIATLAISIAGIAYFVNELFGEFVR